MTSRCRTIYKYVLEITDRQVIDVPRSFEPLCVQVQNGCLCLWAEVEFAGLASGANVMQRVIEIYGTGNPHPADPSFLRSYIGTVQMMDGLVWHVYDGGFCD